MSITVKNLENGAVWQKNVTPEICKRMKDEHLEGKGMVAPILALVVPVRTNNFTNFAKDFFLPTTINHAMRIEDVALQAIAVFVALFVDIISIPLRLLTCLWRIYSNANEEPTPLHTYLTKLHVDQKILAADYVRVKLEWEDPSEDKHWIEKNVNFIEMPFINAYSEIGTRGTSGVHRSVVRA